MSNNASQSNIAYTPKIPNKQPTANKKKSQIVCKSLESTLKESYTIQVGTIGRRIGTDGQFIFHLTSDFASFLRPGLMLMEDRFYQMLTIQNFWHNNANYYIMFEEINSREKAKAYTNAHLYTNEEQTRLYCKLKEGEFFYFDIIGLEVIEENEVLGIVQNIERIGTTDYLLIVPLDSDNTAKKHTKPVKTNTKSSCTNKPKTFMLPYVDAYVVDISLPNDAHKGMVRTQNAKALFFAQH